MMFRRLALMGGVALALVCATAAAAQAPATLSVRDAAGTLQSVATQKDAAGAHHYHDVMEGIAPGQAAPNAWNVDPAGNGHFVRDDTLASGLIPAGTLNSAYLIPLAGGEGTVGVNVSGLTAAGAVLTVEAQNNGSAWYPVNTVQPGTGALSQTISADGNYRINAAGHTAIRLRVSTAASAAASVAVASVASSVSGLTALSASLPGGSNVIGGTIDSGPTSNNAPFQGAVALTVGTSDTATRRSLGANCAAAGNITVTLADGSSLTLPAAVGWQTYPFAVLQVSAMSATCSLSNLK